VTFLVGADLANTAAMRDKAGARPYQASVRLLSTAMLSLAFVHCSDNARFVPNVFAGTGRWPGTQSTTVGTRAAEARLWLRGPGPTEGTLHVAANDHPEGHSR
jgi:hypothetical protein